MTNRFSTGKRLIKPILSVAVALVLLITLFVNTAFADSAKKYDVTVIDGNDTIAVTTTETEPIEILNRQALLFHRVINLIFRNLLQNTAERLQSTDII